MIQKQVVIQHKASAMVVILLMGLIAFEVFNFDTTRFALNDLMAGRRVWGVEWGSVLALAFCSLDFAGLVRILTPAANWSEEPREVWFLTGAWLLGAAMNAVATWYAMSLLITPRSGQMGAGWLSGAAVMGAAPLFIAAMVWLTRVLLIGSMALALERTAEAGGQHRPAGRGGQRPLREPMRERDSQMTLAANGDGRNG